MWKQLTALGRSGTVWPDWEIFGKSWWHIFFQKVAQIYDNFLGYSGNHNTLVKTTVAPFGPTFWKTWATFYFNVWSHWVTLLWNRLSGCGTDLQFFGLAFGQKKSFSLSFSPLSFGCLLFAVIKLGLIFFTVFSPCHQCGQCYIKVSTILEYNSYCAVGIIAMPPWKPECTVSQRDSIPLSSRCETAAPTTAPTFVSRATSYFTPTFWRLSNQSAQWLVWGSVKCLQVSFHFKFTKVFKNAFIWGRKSWTVCRKKIFSHFI